MFRYILGGVREEDLIILLYFLLASSYGKGYKVEAYSAEVFASRYLIVDGRDKEIIEFHVESSEHIVIVRTSFFVALTGLVTSRSRIWRLCRRHLVPYCNARWPCTRVHILVSSVE
jgi:hypothetical protein